jgi:probable HAF family extracellular repeat protein
MKALVEVLRYRSARASSCAAAGLLSLGLAAGRVASAAPQAESATAGNSHRRTQPCHAVKDVGEVAFRGLFNCALGVNASGAVAGAAPFGKSEIHGFVYEKGHQTLLPTLGGTLGDARAINLRGQIVGGSSKAEDRLFRGALWHNGKVNELKTLGGNHSWAVDINEFGAIAGNSTPAGDEPVHAALWTSRGAVVDLGTLGGPASYAGGINDWGVLTGGAQDAYGDYHAVIWRNLKMMRLDDHLSRDSGSFGNKINNAGEVCGSTYSPTTDKAVLFRHGSIIELGDLGGGFSSCQDLGDQGHAVGLSAAPDGGWRAFLWRDQEEGLIDLNTTIAPEAGAFLAVATSINWLGQIAAYGTSDGFQTIHGYLLTPVKCGKDESEDDIGLQ